MDNSTLAFCELVRAGLWNKQAQLSQFTDIDYTKILSIAEEQSVVGLVTAGLDTLADVKVLQKDVLRFVGRSLQIERQNLAMNQFVADIIDRLRKDEIYTVLVKGQGIAQCYDKPLWRSSGDVDLLLSGENYRKANVLLSSIASSVDEENEYNQHIAMTIDGWAVELHGTLRSGLWRRIDKALDKVQGAVFYEGKVRSWMNGRTQVFLPRVDEDVVFVFSHILQHFYKEGIGLRQICDWCRLLWTYRESLNHDLLESRIKEAGLMTEWKAFGALTADYLGMPTEAMPFYSSEVRWRHKADRIMEFVLETGNFGHNRDYSYRQKHSYLVFKIISMLKHVQDFGRYFKIFPFDAIKVTCRRMRKGFLVAIRGKRYELSK